MESLERCRFLLLRPECSSPVVLWCTPPDPVVGCVGGGLKEFCTEAPSLFSIRPSSSYSSSSTASLVLSSSSSSSPLSLTSLAASLAASICLCKWRLSALSCCCCACC